MKSPFESGYQLDGDLRVSVAVRQIPLGTDDDAVLVVHDIADRMAEIGLGEVTLACNARVWIDLGTVRLVTDFLAVVRKIFFGLPRLIATWPLLFDDGIFVIDLGKILFRL